MKVLILGIDALEYKLVEEWNLKNLKQLEYGKIKVPISPGFGEPVTLVVWPCFITGRKAKKMGFDKPIIYRHPLRFVLEKFYFPFVADESISEHEDILAEKSGIKSKIVSNINYVLMKAGMGKYPERKDIKKPTFFDNPNYRSKHKNIPVYDQIFTTEERDSARNGVIRAISDKKFRKVFEQKLKDELDEGIKNVYNELKKSDWDLFMQYFYVLDGVQHVYFKNKLKVMDYYLKFNKFVGEVKKKLPKDTMLFIVSDHGQENGLHTHYGFYSTNIKLGLDYPNIIDFKEIIEERILGVKSWKI